MVLMILFIVATIIAIIDLILVSILFWKSYGLYEQYMGNELARPRFLIERDIYWQGNIKMWLKEANKEYPEGKEALLYVNKELNMVSKKTRR